MIDWGDDPEPGPTEQQLTNWAEHNAHTDGLQLDLDHQGDDPGQTEPSGNLTDDQWTVPTSSLADDRWPFNGTDV